MADTAIAITAGAGTNVDTRTEATNGNHRQVVVIGDPSTNAGVAPVDVTTGLSVDLKGAGLTSLQLIDDTVIADDAAFTPATTKVIMAGFEFDDTTPDSVDEGDAGAARMSANRNIYTTIRDAAGNERGVNVNASNQLAVAGPVTNAGTFAVQAASAGDVAHDAADSGSPIKVGGQARTTNPTAVADADRVNATYDKVGRQLVQASIRTLKAVQQTQISNSTSETTIVTAVASTFLDLYGLILANSGASATTVTVKDDTAGTTRAKIVVPAGETRGFMLPCDAGIPQAVVNKPWTATCSAATTALEVTALTVANI